jgi:serine/threonine protein phosphatase PrpC
MICPSCSAQAGADERFCETCGAALDGAAAPATQVAAQPTGPGGAHDGTLLDDQSLDATDVARRAVVRVQDADLHALPPTCANCGGTVAADGYCEQCGAAAPRKRDHWCDQPASWLAAVCDRGVRHTRNEDAMAVAAAPEPSSLGALVVCDGVSMAPDSDVASLAAARAARDRMIEGLAPRRREPRPSAAAPERSSQRTARAGDFAARIVAAGAVAQEKAALVGQKVPRGKSPPSCTFVAALVERSAGVGPGVMVAGWVGDSRAYWLPDGGGAVQVSSDDSWAAEAIASGVPRAEAEAMPQSHAITRWLGADAHDPVPRTAVVPLDRAGWVLVCSDGLWNYCSEASALADLVATTLAARPADGPPADDPAALAEELTAWAIGKGGHDNITVALARFDPAAAELVEQQVEQHVEQHVEQVEAPAGLDA